MIRCAYCGRAMYPGRARTKRYCCAAHKQAAWRERRRELVERALPDLNAERPRAKWDAKTFGIGAQMLKALGVGRMTLLSQPRKIPSMTGFGLEVSGYLLPEAAHA